MAGELFNAFRSSWNQWKALQLRYGAIRHYLRSQIVWFSSTQKLNKRSSRVFNIPE